MTAETMARILETAEREGSVVFVHPGTLARYPAAAASSYVRASAAVEPGQAVRIEPSRLSFLPPPVRFPTFSDPGEGDG